VLLASCTSGCGIQASEPRETTLSENGANQQENAPGNIVGLWQGTTYVNNCVGAEPGRCGAEQIVTMTIIDIEKSVIGGYYKCAYGNQTCLGQNNTGHIVAVSVNRQNVTVRVVLPDTSSCLFMGRRMGSAIKGGYTCYAGGSILEQGAWHARQLY
jgi:hypothetical protein